MSSEVERFKRVATEALATFTVCNEGEQAVAQTHTNIATQNQQYQDAVPDARRVQADLLATSVQVDPSELSELGGKLVQARATVELCQHRLEHHTAYPLSDSRRALLVAQLQTKHAAIRAEESRRAAHQAALEEALAAAAILDEGITVQVSNSVVDKIGAIVARLHQELETLTRQLAEHDRITEERRAALTAKETL